MHKEKKNERKKKKAASWGSRVLGSGETLGNLRELAYSLNWAVGWSYSVTPFNDGRIDANKTNK